MKPVKTTPKGIDIPIQGLQTVLYDLLKKQWPVDDSTFDCHGRAYRNSNTDGYIPEVFTGSASTGGKEYAEVFFDDRLKALCFFGAGESEKYSSGSSVAKVYLIFMVDVSKLKPAIDHRADEEIHVDVEKICAQKRLGFTFTGLETGIDTVFREYSGWRKKDGIKSRDMHPLHCFRLNFDLLYNIHDC